MNYKNEYEITAKILLQNHFLQPDSYKGRSSAGNKGRKLYLYIVFQIIDKFLNGNGPVGYPVLFLQ